MEQQGLASRQYGYTEYYFVTRVSYDKRVTFCEVCQILLVLLKTKYNNLRWAAGSNGRPEGTCSTGDIELKVSIFEETVVATAVNVSSEPTQMGGTAGHGYVLKVEG